jgi:autotransporter-associated beta strand protein
MSRFIPDRSRRARVLRTGVLIALLVLAIGAVAASAQPVKPNIVVIMSDDAGFNEFGFNSAVHGQSTVFQTPNLDALAQQSVVARQGYAAGPLCSPSRAGLLTGRYQQRFGFEYNIDPNVHLPHETALPGSTMTIAEHLKGIGYTTGMVGKWHVGYEQGVNLPQDKGFDEFYGLWGGGRTFFHEWHPARIIRKGTQDYEAQYRVEGNPSEYDPVRGRYVTDAFGDEAADFVTRHADDQQPFFLYMTPNAPHAPHEAKQQDLAHFAHINDEFLRIKAAMNYALDRSVGKVLSALDDPNGDGNTSDSIRENTIVIFLNDNGGTNLNDNTPFAGNKGLMWEGGIRVPFIVSMPGVNPGVFDAPISAYDILPTVYAAAGGNVAGLNSDGVDLKPYFTGAASGDPHEILFWRTNQIWAARKGDWKYGDRLGNGQPKLHNLATDPGETTDVASQHPQVVADLVRELTHWEATLEKPLWGLTVGNPFDHFVFQGTSVFSLWNSPGNWKDAATGNAATMTRADGYANTILEFQTRNNSDFFASNNMVRMTLQPFMLNELRFTGNFTGATNRLGKLQDNSLLLVRNLAGENPKLRLDATSSGTSARFRFFVFNELQLLDDLEITGNGTQEFFFARNIRDFDVPRNITKTGTSRVILAGNNTFGGNLTIQAGEVFLTANNPEALHVAAINGAHSIVVGSSGSFVMDSGLVNVARIDRSAGGNFQFTGGELRVTDFVGSLTNQGGNFSPGDSTALSTVSGNFTQIAGSLTIELAGATPGTGFDQLSVGGSASLAGLLEVDLLDGFLPNPGSSFEILRATGGISGTFAPIIAPVLPGRLWRLEYEPNSVRLLVDAVANNLPGDYNFDGVVDAADYLVWRNAFSSTFDFAADGNGNGMIDQGDYAIWRANFGRIAPAAASGSSTGSVPEPGTLSLAFMMMLAMVMLAYRTCPSRQTRYSRLMISFKRLHCPTRTEI